MDEIPEIILKGEWPDSNSIHLIRAVYESFVSLAGVPVTESLIIKNDSGRDSPEVLYEKSKGADVIWLAVKGAGYWSQISYQLSHELCHLLCNFREQRNHPHKWLEESLCELASLQNMLTMARIWRVIPPLPHVGYYAKHLEEYVQDIVDRETSNCPLDEEFYDWLGGRFDLLASDPYRRSDNTIVALRLLPLFMSKPELWKAASFLNRWDCSENQTFSDYLNAWKENSPADQHENIILISRTLTKRI